MIQYKPLETTYEWNWFKAKTSVLLCEDMQGLIAHRGGHILAACAADSFTVHACSVHLVIDNPIVLRHRFLETIAEYLFLQRDRHYIFGLVPSNNYKAQAFDQHIGFREVALIPDALAEGVDYIVMRMDRKDCRWLPEELREVA